MTFALFEEKLHRLVFLYKRLKAQSIELQHLLLVKEGEYDSLRKEFSQLEYNYTNLKQAKVISLSDAEIGSAKERISKLVREIDRCIEILNQDKDGKE